MGLGALAAKFLRMRPIAVVAGLLWLRPAVVATEFGRVDGRYGCACKLVGVLGCGVRVERVSARCCCPPVQSHPLEWLIDRKLVECTVPVQLHLYCEVLLSDMHFLPCLQQSSRLRLLRGTQPDLVRQCWDLD
jgi:hypothetical protein